MSTRQKLLWVVALYFAEGFPFGLVADALPVYFRLQGVSLTDIGLLGLVGLPWTLKFLWAPAVDLWGRRRTWIWVCQALMSVPLLTLAFLHTQEQAWVLWAVLVLLAVLSATQDIAIDAYTIELLDKKEMGVANGVRVTAYRIALIGAGGLFVAAAGYVGWTSVFIGAAGLMGLLAVVSSSTPEARTERADGQPARSMADAIREPLR
jgi:PAT family beta-lactamase induction signal transducer AmpG